MAKYTEQQIHNIYLRCNAAPMTQLLNLCLDPETGITVDGLREAKYNKIDQLEEMYNAQAEDVEWESSKNSIDLLLHFIDKCEQGIFSDNHLDEAKVTLRQLAAEREESDWNHAMGSNNLNVLNEYIQKCTNGTYSDAHLQQAKEIAELIDWQQAKDSHNAAVLNGFILKCNNGIYSSVHVDEAKEMLEQLENGTIISEWENLVAISDSNSKLMRLNEFIQKYATNPTNTAQQYMQKATELMERLRDAEQARVDWIDAKQKDTILDYSCFLKAHPYCEYREEAEQRIQSMKGDLLNDMKRSPFKYHREEMFGYISTNTLTMHELVDESCVLTDRGYSHIKRFPTLKHEQRDLPVSHLENPCSQNGNTDVFFFGVSGSGKTCVLSGLMSLTGQLGFKFDPKGPGGGGSYAIELRNYARHSMLPPATDQKYIQVIDAQINNENGSLSNISFIEMSGEKTAQFAAINNPTSLDDLGQGAAGLLSNDNRKLIFFVIDPTNQKNIQMGQDSHQFVMQSDVLDCVSSLLSKNPLLMKKVCGIHIILTKSDTLGDYVDQTVVQNMLNEQGYAAVLSSIKDLCQKYDINKQTGFQVGLYPFCVGRFMPGDVYTFDETDSLKILRVVQKNVGSVRRTGGFFDSLRDFFNS